MKKIELIRKLETQPLFTFNEFVRITGKSSEYSRVYIHRLKKEGLIFKIERGKYTTHTDPLTCSSYIIIPSYISFWTALMLHHLTEQLPISIMIASPKSKKPINFQGTKIYFYKTKHMWGYKKERFLDLEIFIAEKEKTIIDSLLIKNIPFDEIAKAIKTKEFEQDKLVNFAIKTKNSSLMKRVGFLMEHFNLNAEKLTQYLDNNYVLLDWHGAKKGKKNKKWKIIVNRRLYDIN